MQKSIRQRPKVFIKFLNLVFPQLIILLVLSRKARSECSQYRKMCSGIFHVFNYIIIFVLQFYGAPGIVEWNNYYSVNIVINSANYRRILAKVTIIQSLHLTQLAVIRTGASSFPSTATRDVAFIGTHRNLLYQ